MTEIKKITAIMILDVIGKPPKHLVESLENLISEIEKEKGITVTSKNIKEPTLMKDQEEFYTTFAEVEIEMEEILYLATLLFKYMPAHIEVISPEILALSNNGWNDVLNELTRRLHGYDEIARMMQMEKEILLKKIKELGGEIPMTPLAKKSDFPEEIRKLEKQKKKKKVNKKIVKKKK